jgi:hypothetical protein
MTLFLFVIMLIGVDRSEDPTERLPLQRPLALALGGALVIVVVVAGRAAWITGIGGPGPASGTIENVSDQLFGTWLLPFEATVLLLTIAAVGTVALAQFGRVPSVPPTVAPSVADQSFGDTSPAKPGDASPAKPGDASPAKPGEGVEGPDSGSLGVGAEGPGEEAP